MARQQATRATHREPEGRLAGPRLGAFVTVAMLGLAAVGARSAEVVVIASTDDRLPAGTVLDGSARATIPSGARVTLISATGKRIELQGPYDGPPDTSRNNDRWVIEGIASALTAERRKRLAVFRGAPATPPDWSVDVTRSGTYCARDAELFFLWRRRGRVGSIALEHVASGTRVRVAWPEGERSLPWPAALPLEDGANYFAHVDAAIGTTELVIRKLPTELNEEGQRIAWMEHNGCSEQAQRRLRALVAGG